MLESEFYARDGVRAVVKALKAHPEQAKELLSHDYSPYKRYEEIVKAVNEIVPSLTGGLKKANEPVNELYEINKSLQEWLKRYNPKEFHAGKHERMVKN